MKTTNYFAVLIFFVILGIGIAVAYAIYGAQATTEGRLIDVVALVIALFIAPKIVEFMGLGNLNQYLSPDVIFTSIKNIANSIFNGNSASGFSSGSGVTPNSINADFSDL